MPVGEPGLVSVVVAATDAHREFLAECLDSLRTQRHRAFEVHVVPYGSCAEVTELARALASQDDRIELHDEAAPDLAAARSAGADAASGEYLTFVGAGDRLPPRALAALVGTLGKSGSDFAVANVTQPRSVGRTRVALLRSNEQTSKRARVVDVPELVTDTAVEARLFRSDFWRRRGLELSDDGRSLRSVPLLSALLDGARVDVLARVAYQSMGRGEGAPLGQQPVVMPQVTGWLATQHQVAALLDGADALRDAWLLHVLDVEAIPFLDDVERADADEWTALSAGVRELLDRATPEVWARVRAESRVKVWLAAHDRRAALEDFVVARWHTAGNKPTTVEHRTVYGKLPYFRDAAVGVPLECYALTERETRLHASLRRARWVDDATLELTVFALIDFVDMTGERPSLSATLVDRAGDSRIDLPVQQFSDPAVTRFGGRRFQGFDGGAFTLTVDARRLAEHLDTQPVDLEQVAWQLELTMRVRGVERTGVLAQTDVQGSAMTVPAREVSSWTVSLEPATDRPVLLGVTRPQAAAPGEDLLGPHLTEFHLEQDELVFTGLWHGDTPESWSLHLEDDRGSVPGEVTKVHDTFMVRFSPSQSRWGRPELPLPSGTYRLRLETHDGGGTPYSVSIDQALADLLPVEELSSTHRIKVFRTGSGEPAVRLSAPLTDEELGPYRQQQLQDWFTHAEHDLDEKAVYFQSYVGQVATDSPLAIHEELHRTRPDLTLYWGVADHSTVLPEGAVPVLINSRRWYDVLATSKYLVANVDFDPWFRKQPGQRFLETFHGYPAKSMGLRLFEGKQFTPRRIDLELERTAKKWDLILTPTPEMDRYYREEYRYDGEIHNQGYPRDDVLTSPHAERIRHETRRVLGIAEGKTVVLYAPTWRDHLATKHYSAKMAKYLDVEAAADALGDDYVLLLRGHRFHATGNERAKATARILDVTDYPEINDLILAADVGVLDYSSLRFDFGLTGKPMVFLVPDLGLYTGRARGFLFDYYSTAPGPLLDTGDEVVAALQHLDRLDASYADARKRFVEQYHYWQDGHATQRVVAAFFE